MTTLGTPQELTDYSGEIMWSAKYRAYGNLATLDIAEIDNPLRFQGQYFDAETGLHYNRHRYYNPGTGRFLTPDPIKLAGGLNNYQYVPNPTGWVDPLGLNGCPGDDSAKQSEGNNPATEPAVNAGEPSAPKMSQAERQARINQLAEANAHKELQKMEAATPGAHFLEKHGAQTTLPFQLERASTGKNPTTRVIETFTKGKKAGQAKMPSAATRYISHRDQLNAINRALQIFKRTGDVDLASEPIEMGRKIGEGYKKGSLSYGSQTKAVTRISDQGKVITSYPEY